MKLRLIVLLAILMALSGCTWRTPIVETKIVYRDKIVLITPSDGLLTKINIPKPPSKALFMESTDIERVNILTDYTIELMNGFNKTNSKLKTLREWKEKQTKLYGDKK